jgi:outer membrane protein TolC
VGSIGYAAKNFSELFNSQAFRGAIGPSFQWNILNYGRIQSQVRLQEARFQAQIAIYQNTVLKANQEVENGLITFLKAHERVRFAAESVKAAEKAVRAAQAQYRNGLVDFNRVALLEQNLVTQQNLLAEARGEIAQGLIQVYRALGGGWEIRCSEGEEGHPDNTPPAEVMLKVKVQPSMETVVPHAIVSPSEPQQGRGGWR